MLTCREIADFLMAYVDGDLSPAERQEFDRHLEVCPPCVHYLRNYRETIRLGKAAMDESSGGPIPEELVRAILSSRKAGG